MYRFFSVAFCIAVLIFNCDAQSDLPHEKKFNHYLGFQANELMRQLINFDDATEVNNPYLGVYAISWASMGLGLHFGAGFNYRTTLNKNEPVARETKVNDFFYRIGAEKRFSLGKKFEVALSLDFTSGYQLDKTTSLSVTNLGSQVDSSTSTVTGKTTSIGGGPRASLGFHISERIILSTEATMYYSDQEIKQNRLVVETITPVFPPFFQEVSSSNFNEETDIKGFTFSIPISLFLIVKF